MTSTCDHVVLYDQPRHAICVEPQTGPPDALNHLERATLVRRGRPLVAEMSLVVASRTSAVAAHAAAWTAGRHGRPAVALSR